MAAVDRLRSFYGDQLLCRTGTLASLKSFGSAVSGAASAVSGAETSTIADGTKLHRPGDEDVVIDPYQLDPDESSSSSDEDDGDLSRPDSGSGLDDDEAEVDETEWTSASGDDAGAGPGSLRSAAAASRRGVGGRSVAAMSTRTARSARSRKAGPGESSSAIAGASQGGSKGVSIADAPLLQGPRGPRSVAASNWGARSRRSVATTARSAATSVANSEALSAVPSGAPGGVVSVRKLDARLAGRAVQRRLQRRRGWEFDLVPDEIDFTLGRPLHNVLTRPQPTADSDEEPEDDAGGDDEDDEQDSLGAGGSPPPGPVLEAIKSYAHERAPEVVWTERVKHAKRVARQTGQTVTVRGRLEPKKRRELARKIQKWDNREWFNSRKRAPPAPPLHPAVERVIEQWFQLVDDDGGGTLDREELLTALQASDVPVKPENIDEMIALMDLDRDGVISWKEFVTFFMYEFAAGKNLLSGEYVLPSGVALPFGAMIAKLKRDRLVADLMQGGHARAKWQNIAESPIALEDELGMMAAVELAMEEMKNPALGRARARAAKAMNKLPAHLRTPSMARHLQRHPEVADKLLRAPSMAALLAATSLKRAPSSGNIMARLASTNSNGSIASRNSSMAGGGAGSTGGGSTGGGGGGTGASGGRGGNVDLNVAVALAAGLEWPVEGASFYNKRAKTVLRAACQKPPDAILRAAASAGTGAASAPAASARHAATHAAVASGAGAGAGAGAPGSFRKQASGRRGLSVEAVAAASATAAAIDGGAPQVHGRLLHGGTGGVGTGGSGSRRRGGSDSGGEEAGGRRRRGGAGAESDTSEEVLPWLVNAKRREEEERQELRERLMRGASSKSAAASVLAANGSDGVKATRASADSDAPRRRSGLLEGVDEEEGLWVSPLLKRWLTVERERLRQPSGEVDASPAVAAPATEVSAAGSRTGSVSVPLEIEVSRMHDSSGPGAAAATPTTITSSLSAVRVLSTALDNDLEAAAAAGGMTPATARKPRRRMRFIDEQEDAPEDDIGNMASSGAPADEDYATAGHADASATTSDPAVFLGSLGPHTCALGDAPTDVAAALVSGASGSLPDDPSASWLRTARRSVLLSSGPEAGADASAASAASPALAPLHPALPGQSPRGSGLLRTSRLDAPSPLNAGNAGGEVGASPLRASYGPALQQWALGSASAAVALTDDSGTELLEPLDAEEARELMAGITLQLSKEDTLYHIHTGHEADRPTTSDFRAALTRMRLAAAALVQSYALPPHPEYSGAAAPSAAALSPEASQPQMPLPPGGASLGATSRMQQGSGLAYALGPQPHVQPQRPESPSASVTLSTRPSAMSVGPAHSSVAVLHADRGRGRTHSSTGAAEGASGGGGPAALSARSRGTKVVARAPGLVVAGVASTAHQRTNSPQPYTGASTHAHASNAQPHQQPQSSSPALLCSPLAQSPHLSYDSDGITPEASQPYSMYTYRDDGAAPDMGVSVPADGQQQPQGPPCHSPDPGILAAAIATARSMSRAGFSRPASRARSPSPLRPGAQSPTRAAGPRPGSRLGSPVPSGLLAPGALPNPRASRARAEDTFSSAAPPEGLGAASQTQPALSLEPPGTSQVQPQPLPEAWDARVAALLQRHTAVELAAVQQQALLRTASPDGSKTARPAAGGGGVTARGAGLGPGVAALLTSRRAGGRAQLLRGAGSVLPARAKSSTALLRLPEAQAVVAAPRYVPAQSSAATEQPSVAPRSDPAPVLLPLSPSGSLPDFIHMPGAMPRLQSRYAAKRPAVAVAPEHLSTGSQVSRNGSRGGARLPDPLAEAEEGGDEGSRVEAAEGADAGPPPPLWQDSVPEPDDDEPDSPQGWGAGSNEAAAGSIHVSAWRTGEVSSGPYEAPRGGEVLGSATDQQDALSASYASPSEMPQPGESLSCATDIMASRPSSAASSATALQMPREHLLLSALLPGNQTPAGIAGAASDAATFTEGEGPAVLLHPPLEPEQAPLGSHSSNPTPACSAEAQSSRRKHLLQGGAQYEALPQQEQQEQGRRQLGAEEAPRAEAKGSAEASAMTEKQPHPLGSAAPAANDKPCIPMLARLEQQHQQQHGRARGGPAAGLSRLGVAPAMPAGSEPAAADHAPVPPLPLNAAMMGAPVAGPTALLSPYSGGTVLAGGFKLPNPSRLKGLTSVPPSTPAADSPAMHVGGLGAGLGGRSPVSGPPVAGAVGSAGGQTTRLVGDLASLTGTDRGGPDSRAAPTNPGSVHTTVYLAVAAGPEQRPVAVQQPSMFPPLARDHSGAALPGGADGGPRAASQRSRQLFGGHVGAVASRGAGGGLDRRGGVSESLPALPLRSLSQEGQYGPLSLVPRSLAGLTKDDSVDQDRPLAAAADDRQIKGVLVRTAPAGSAPQPFFDMHGGPAAASSQQGARRRAAWGESAGAAGLGTALPAAHLSAPWGEVAGSSQRPALPDIVALLSREPPVPLRTGPIRIERIDI